MTKLTMVMPSLMASTSVFAATNSLRWSFHVVRSLAQQRLHSSVRSPRSYISEVKRSTLTFSDLGLPARLSPRQTFVSSSKPSEFPSATSTSPDQAVATSTTANAAISSKPPPPTGLLARFKGNLAKGKQMMMQYYNGSKQLYRNFQASTELLKKVRKEGYVVNRAEYMLMKTTEQDAKKLLPFFLVLLIIPESLPFLIVWSPGFLPSTCMSRDQIQTSWEAMAKRRKEISAEVLEKLSTQPSPLKPAALNSNKSFLNLLKSSAELTSDYTLFNLKRPDLVTYCKYLGLGHRTLLPGRMRLRLMDHYALIRGDDLLIQKEGIESLSEWDLRAALESRGVVTQGLSLEELRAEMERWLEVSLNEEEVKVPEGLLALMMAVRNGLKVGNETKMD
ncbi:hypothetical protein HDV05_008813 [Chytridiales sp. JEL 0842]|nr:hypothetical protein HDV05_008813 [Chytridiales sp. JEL 0842]